MENKKDNYIDYINKIIGVNSKHVNKSQKINLENANLLFDAVENNPLTIIKSPRQTGCSTFLAAYCALYPHKNILYIGVKKKNGEYFLNNIDKVGLEYSYRSKDRREFDRRGKIHTAGDTCDATIGFSADIVIIDQAAFMVNVVMIFTSIVPMLSTGGKLIVVSTPMEKKGWFYDMFTNENNNFHKLSLKPIFHEDDPEVKERYQGRDKMYVREILGEFINNITLKPLKIPPVRVEREVYSQVMDRLKELSLEQNTHITISDYIRDLIMKDLENNSI